MSLDYCRYTIVVTQVFEFMFLIIYSKFSHFCQVNNNLLSSLLVFKSQLEYVIETHSRTPVLNIV